MLKYMLKKVNNRKGFTLVELIVVIAVLGILATLTVPQFAGIRTKANQAVDDQTAALMQKGIDLYNAENNNYPADAAAAKTAIHDVLTTIPAVKVTGNIYKYDTGTHKISVDKTAATATNVEITDDIP